MTSRKMIPFWIEMTRYVNEASTWRSNSLGVKTSTVPDTELFALEY